MQSKNFDYPLWLGIGLAISCGFIAAIGFGLLGPLYSLKLDDIKMPNDIIGLLITIIGVVPLFISPYVPLILSKVPLKVTLFISVIIGILLLYAFTIGFSTTSWTIIRMLFAILGSFLFISSESYILELAPPKYHGRVMGVYAVLFYGGIGLGGVLVSKFGYQNNKAIYISMALFTILLPLFLFKTQTPTPPQIGKTGFNMIFHYLKNHYVLFLPAIAIGGVETAAFNLFPLWVRKIGLPDDMSGLILGAIALGNIILQFPIGFFGDKIGRIKVLSIIIIVSIIAPIILLFVHNSILILIIIAIWAGFVTGFYIMGLVGIAQHSDIKEIAGFNATFGFCYCLGMFISPLFGGILMQNFGANGLMFCFIILAALPIFSVINVKKSAQVS